jgi:hypothetical protein
LRLEPPFSAASWSGRLLFLFGIVVAPFWRRAARGERAVRYPLNAQHPFDLIRSGARVPVSGAQSSWIAGSQ